MTNNESPRTYNIGDAVLKQDARPGGRITMSTTTWYVVRISTETYLGKTETLYHLSKTPGKGKGGYGYRARNLTPAL